MEKVDFNTILTKLRQSPDVMPWVARRGVVRRLASSLADGDHTESVLQLAYLLAIDPKWEVRTDVAELLLLLPEEHFARLAAILSDDTNSFVRRAVERALDRRRRGQQATRRSRQEFNQVQSQYAAMEKLHGKVVADKARKIAERLFDHMVTATIHEMRSILTPLMASTSSLLHHLDNGQFKPAEFRRQLTKTADRFVFLERLVEDMRTYTQPPPNERCQERLAELVETAAAMVRENLEVRGRRPDGVLLAVDIPSTFVVNVSRHLMLVAIGNVLKNAYDAFTVGPNEFRPGEIAISARRTDDESVELVVRDNGMGISAEDLQEILDFVPGKTTKKNLGTGFGLPIAQRNLAAHGGSIGIQSEADIGTTVTILIPMDPDAGGKYDLRSIGD